MKTAFYIFRARGGGSCVGEAVDISSSFILHRMDEAAFIELSRLSFRDAVGSAAIHDTARFIMST